MSAAPSGDMTVQMHAMNSKLSVESEHSEKSGFRSPKCTKLNRISSKIRKHAGNERRLCRKSRFVHRLSDLTMKRKRRTDFVLPKRFLLGGTITDPLNLSGLNEDTEHQSTKLGHAPTCGHKLVVSQYPAANITDPLYLNEDFTDSSEHAAFQGNKELASQNEERCSKEDASELKQMELADPAEKSQFANFNDSKEFISVNEEECADQHMNESKFMVFGEKLCSSGKDSACVTQSSSKYGRISGKNCQVNTKDRIVSPAVRQSCQKRKKRHFQTTKPKELYSADSVGLPMTSKLKSKKFPEKYSSGNYLAYYGYRNSTKSDDPRLKLFSCEIFEGKDVLDIGCNAGLVTISVAQSFHPHLILGLDIDPRLIEAAKRNVRLFVSRDLTNRANYPKLMETLYGPASAGCLTASENKASSQPSLFPHNIAFQVSDYVLPGDDEVHLQREEYDVILALSVTKWIHLNHGDDGLRRSFRRMIRQLRPGGKLILEAQPWSSYKRKKKLTDKIHEVYQSIKFLPDQFNDYLLSNDVGFASCELLGTPFHESKGFQRPVYVFTKPASAEN